MRGNTSTILEWEVLLFTSEGTPTFEKSEIFIGSRFDAPSKAQEIAADRGHPWRVRLTNIEDPHDFYESDYIDFDDVYRFLRS